MQQALKQIFEKDPLRAHQKEIQKNSKRDENVHRAKGKNYFIIFSDFVFQFKTRELRPKCDNNPLLLISLE